MFFDLVRVYANINPGILYGIINNNSLKLVATVICKAPNTNPDVIINNILFLNIFLMFNLNINSSVSGAINMVATIVYIGYLPNSFVMYSWLVELFILVIFIIIMFVIIISPRFKNQYFK